MANRIRTDDPRGFNKGRSSKFREGSRVRQTPEEGRRTYRPKRYGNNNKDEDNSPKTLNDENQSFPSPRKVAIPELKSPVYSTIYARCVCVWGGRIVGFVWVCEMQIASSRIWTRTAVSIFYNDNIASRVPFYILRAC